MSDRWIESIALRTGSWLSTLRAASSPPPLFFLLRFALVLSTWQRSGPGCPRWTSDSIISTGESRDGPHTFPPGSPSPHTRTHTDYSRTSFLNFNKIVFIEGKKKTKQDQTFINDKKHNTKSGLGHINKKISVSSLAIHVVLNWKTLVTTDIVTRQPQSFILLK